MELVHCVGSNPIASFYKRGNIKSISIVIYSLKTKFPLYVKREKAMWTQNMWFPVIYNSADNVLMLFLSICLIDFIPSALFSKTRLGI